MYRSWSHLRKECLWLGQSKYIHQKIQIGANIKMPAHFTANAGSLVTTPLLASPCTRSSVCRTRRPSPGKSRISVCIANTGAGAWRLRKKRNRKSPLPAGSVLPIQPRLHRPPSKENASSRNRWHLRVIARRFYPSYTHCCVASVYSTSSSGRKNRLISKSAVSGPSEPWMILKPISSA